jgi:AraC-like DNA-binding protein
MLEIGRVNCYGHCAAPDTWVSKVYNEINRLYYIHSGTGGFRHRGKFTEFKPGHLYFFPFLVDAELISDKNDKIVHSYCNFELIPPIIAGDVLEYDPEGDEITKSAISVFVAGAKLRQRSTASLRFDISDDFDRLCKNAISFLAAKTADMSGASAINDSAVIEAIKIIHSDFSKKLKVSDLAKSCYMNEDSFIRRFRRSIGITPYAYIKKLRIRTAFYLRDLGLPLEKIARQTGYSDSASLLHALADTK